MPASGWGGICSLGGERGREGESSTAGEDMAAGRWGILDVDNMEGGRGEEDEQVGRGQKMNGEND